jgi:hypothetical protein
LLEKELSWRSPFRNTKESIVFPFHQAWQSCSLFDDGSCRGYWLPAGPALKFPKHKNLTTRVRSFSVLYAHKTAKPTIVDFSWLKVNCKSTVDFKSTIVDFKPTIVEFKSTVVYLKSTINDLIRFRLRLVAKFVIYRIFTGTLHCTVPVQYIIRGFIAVKFTVYSVQHVSIS